MRVTARRKAEGPKLPFARVVCPMGLQIHFHEGIQMVCNRLSWDEYFMQITDVVAKRSTCLRRQVGAIIVKDKQIISTGYNGAPRGLAHCLDIGCLRDRLGIPSGQRHEICRGLHAEQNAIVQAAYHGVSIEGGTVYCTHQPCFICAKMIINAGLVRVVYSNGYPDELASSILREANVELVALTLAGQA